MPKGMTGEMHNRGIYEKYVKRLFDIICSAAFMIVFCWLYAIIALLVYIKIGKPIIFKQPRPGMNEKIFYMCKFRTMTDAHDASGKLLPDDKRMTPFGKWLRSTSLDELPEVWLIFTGKMSCVGPRPQLVRDMTFMTDKQRRRHSVRPGLTGLAQISGRNAITWEDKLACDIRYVDNISFLGDVKILFTTVFKVFKREGITEENMETAEDFGDYLLRSGSVTPEEYESKQKEALLLLK